MLCCRVDVEGRQAFGILVYLIAGDKNTVRIISALFLQATNNAHYNYLHPACMLFPSCGQITYVSRKSQASTSNLVCFENLNYLLPEKEQ